MIYFDNAATTQIDPEVLAVMNSVLKDHYGNPSSIHALGRESRVIIEDCRRKVGSFFNTAASNIFFTSCGTEAINTAIMGAVRNLGIRNIISSAIEHHAVSHTLNELKNQGLVNIHYVNLLHDGHIDMLHLEQLLFANSNSLVCLMHANNEIGTLLTLEETASICKKHNALFFADTVQTIGKYHLDFAKLNLHFAACSAHKFHGPKGIGFLYVNEEIKISPLMHGGGQERNMRSGTENIAGIAGLSVALEVAFSDFEQKQKNIMRIRDYMVEKLRKNFDDLIFNNDLTDKGLYNLINVSFPSASFNEMLLQNLDISGVCASGGSACSSGAINESPVLKAIGCDTSLPTVRFSFGKFNNLQEVDKCISVLKDISDKS